MFLFVDFNIAGVSLPLWLVCFCSISIYSIFLLRFVHQNNYSPCRNERVKRYCELCVVFISLGFRFFFFFMQMWQINLLRCFDKRRQSRPSRITTNFLYVVQKFENKKESKNRRDNRLTTKWVTTNQELILPVAIPAANQFRVRSIMQQNRNSNKKWWSAIGTAAVQHSKHTHTHPEPLDGAVFEVHECKHARTIAAGQYVVCGTNEKCFRIA